MASTHSRSRTATRSCSDGAARVPLRERRLPARRRPTVDRRPDDQTVIVRRRSGHDPGRRHRGLPARGLHSSDLCAKPLPRRAAAATVAPSSGATSPRLDCRLNVDYSGGLGGAFDRAQRAARRPRLRAAARSAGALRSTATARRSAVSTSAALAAALMPIERRRVLVSSSTRRDRRSGSSATRRDRRRRRRLDRSRVDTPDWSASDPQAVRRRSRPSRTTDDGRCVLRPDTRSVAAVIAMASGR